MSRLAGSAAAAAVSIWLAAAGPAAAAPAGGAMAAAPPPRAEPPAGFTGSAAYRALRRSGREVVAERDIDLDGDGRDDALVVARSPAGLDLAAYRCTGPGRYALLTRSAPLVGAALGRLEPLALGQRAGWLLDVVEDSPDEADHRLALFVANPVGLARVFSGRWRQTHPEHEAGRAAEDRLDLGGLALGLQLRAAPAGGGWPRLILRDQPEELLFSASDGPALRVRIGVRERLYVHRGARYVEHEERFRSYLQPVTVNRIEPLADGEAGAAGARAADGGPLAQLVDGSPATSRTLPSGSRLALQLAGAARLRALRLVSGCAAGGRVTRLGLRLDDGPRLRIDATSPGRLAAPLAAVGDYRLAGRAAAGQTLVFFAAPQSIERLELSIEAVAPAGGAACVVELTPLTARGQRPKP